MSDIGPRDELYMVNPEGKMEKMDLNEHHLEYLMNFYPEEEDYNEDFWETIFEGGWIRIELKENHRNGWDLAVNGKSMRRMKAIIRDNFIERLKRGENKVHIEEWTGTGMNPTKNFYLPMQKEEFYDFILESIKAKFIHESLDFERGIDPKDAMEIGEASLVKQKIIEILRKDEEDLSVFFGIEIKEEDWLMEIPHHGYCIEFHLAYGKSLKKPEEYAKKLLKNVGLFHFVYPQKVKIQNIQLDPMFRIKEEFEKFFPEGDYNTVDLLESQNFERGLEPKISMDVGQEARKRKLDKETDWGFEFSHAFHVKTYDVTEYEGFLIKIVQVMGSDGVAYYAALNNTGEPYNDTPNLYNTPEEALDWEQKYLDQYIMGL